VIFLFSENRLCIGLRNWKSGQGLTKGCTHWFTTQKLYMLYTTFWQLLLLSSPGDWILNRPKFRDFFQS
jgi:hypothetical protein